MTHKRHLPLPDHHSGNVENARQDTVANMASCVGRPDRLAPSDGDKFRVQVAAPTTREISHKSLTLMPPNPVTSALTVADWFAETLAAAHARRIYGIVGDSLDRTDGCGALGTDFPYRQFYPQGSGVRIAPLNW